MRMPNVYAILLLLTILVGCDSSTKREQNVRQRFLDNGFIPPNAADVLVKDNHGGFHGDGLTFVAFSCVEVPPSFWTKHAEWKPMPLEKRAQTTFDVVCGQLNVPEPQKPNLKSSTLAYFIDDKSDYREIHTGHLFLKDDNTHQYWYLNWTE